MAVPLRLPNQYRKTKLRKLQPKIMTIQLAPHHQRMPDLQRQRLPDEAVWRLDELLIETAVSFTVSRRIVEEKKDLDVLNSQVDPRYPPSDRVRESGGRLKMLLDERR
jgi:hypothetical protein